MEQNFKRNLLVGFGISVTILLVSSIASFFSISSLLESNAAVNQTQEVLYNLSQARANLVDAQTNMRGFLITGKTQYVARMDSGKALTDVYLKKLEDITLDNKPQVAALIRIQETKIDYFDFLDVRASERSKGFTSTAADLEQGSKFMLIIQNEIKEMEKTAQVVLKKRNLTSEKFGTYSSIMIIAAAIIAILLSIIFFLRILSDFNVRTRLQQALEEKDRETDKRISIISSVASEISNGNYDVSIDDDTKDSLGNVGSVIEVMAVSLKKSFSDLEDQEWLQAGIAHLNDVMLGEKTLEKLCEDLITQLCEYTESSAGALYVLEHNALRLAGSYNYLPNEEKKYIKNGEGLAGQAVKSKKILQLKNVDQNEIVVSYALGEIKPRHIIAIPLFENTVEGVVELASLTPIDGITYRFLSVIGNNIGIALRSAQNRKRLAELLEETQSQSEELRVQHTELESMNAELETKTEKLQASEEELRVQQEELQQTNEELAERSVLLEEQNVEIQKKSEALEISTRYKSEFLANMSHELRTPLNSILLLSRLLSENNEANLNQEQIEFATVIQSSGNGLLSLIDEILDLSKIEAGKMDVEIVALSTKDVTDGISDLFTQVAKQKNIDLIIDDSKAPLVIKTDKMRLEQILKNLISNAIKFTDKGAVTLKIETDQTNPKIVNFSVTDTGIGIAKDQQPLVFEAFQQADGSTKRKYGGTGLGLSISRELAKLLHGEILLESEPGKGSTFTLRVPLAASAQDKLQNLIQSDPVVAAEIIPTAPKPFISSKIPLSVTDDREHLDDGTKTILIVEDDPNFAKSLLKFARARNYKGVVCVRGDKALGYALKYHPVGILLDVELPIKSGFEVMEELKSNTATRHIPVHIMSSHKLRQESMLKGAVKFLHKADAFEEMPEVFKRIEKIVSQGSQKVLIIEDNPKHAKALAYYLETFNIKSEIKSEVNDGVKALTDSDLNCVILDMGIPDQKSYNILEDIKKSPGLENLPVIVFTGKSLSITEEVKIKKYADSIIVKTAHSYKRMLDEVSLFLHLMEGDQIKNGGKSSKKLSQLNDVLSGKTVLVVDDDVRNIYSLTKSLEVLKMNVITAIDGREALQVLEENPNTDVVLLDMMMPNMDGYETARNIRENSKFSKLPVIAVTAKAMTGDREKCINAGASDYITKPVDIDQLLSLLRVWLYDSI